jgi:hypothetical protein
MNTTNRGANRALIFVVGLVVVLLGAVSVLIGVVPAFTSGWKSTAPTVSKNVASTFHAAPFFSTGSSWLYLALIAVLVIIVIVLVRFIVKQGNGHTSELFHDDTTEHGSTIVKAGVAKQALQDALEGRDDLVSSSVSTYDVQGTNVLKISATARRGVSPKAVSDAIQQNLKALDQLLGFEVPALIQISGGFRARTAKKTRLL